jgi:hypothetical protein
VIWVTGRKSPEQPAPSWAWGEKSREYVNSMATMLTLGNDPSALRAAHGLAARASMNICVSSGVPSFNPVIFAM